MRYTKLQLKDEAFSGEEFQLEKDSKGVLKTVPVPEKIEFYYNFGAYISHQNDGRNFLTVLYNIVKKMMLKKKLNLLKESNENLNSVLDFGCGIGDFVGFSSEKKLKAEGVEPTSIAFDKAKKRGLSVYKSIQESKATYDAITLFHVLEHVEDYDETIHELVERLNPEGHMLIAVPNYKSYDARYYKDKWAAWDVPRHLWHFSKKDIEEIGKRHNLELIKIEPMLWDAFYISMISESYKGNMKLKGIYRGLLSNLKAVKTKEFSSNLFLLKKGPSMD